MYVILQPGSLTNPTDQYLVVESETWVAKCASGRVKAHIISVFSADNYGAASVAAEARNSAIACAAFTKAQAQHA